MVRLSEVLPDPVGTDTEQEFIEIENGGEIDAELSGWTLQNAAGKSFALSGTVAAHGQHAFAYAETKIALVNGGMMLTLIDPQAATFDTVTYGAAKEGKAYAKTASGEWLWTSTPTPGNDNRFDPEPVKEPAPAEPPQLTLPVEEPVAVPPPTPASVVTNDASKVSIDGFMPDPVGDDAAEWVRLVNAGAADASMDGWSLDDDEGGSRPFILAAVTVPASGTLVLPRSMTKLALNNDADAVRLLAPDGTVKARVAYAQPPEGKSYEFVDGSWRWMPEDAPSDAITSASMDAAPPTSDDRGGAGEEAADAVDIADLDAADDGELATIAGAITVPPGVLGKRTFAMQQADGAAGVFVRAYGRGDLPQLASGDIVRIVGRVRRERGTESFATVGRRVFRTGHATLAYAERTIEELSDADEGLALSVTGIVAHRGKATLTIADEGMREEIEARTRTASYPGAVAGAKVSVRGTVRMRDGKIEIIAAAKDAVAVLAPPITDAPTDESMKDAPSQQASAVPARAPMVFGYTDNKKAALLAVVLVAASALAGLAYVFFRRRHADALE